MRIISGKFKNKQIISPKDDRTHPMGERERLAIFNMLNGEIEGANILDVYAGTGSLGIEALSNGASKVTFVEKSSKIAKNIKQNILNLKDEDAKKQTAVITSDISKFNCNETFDIIFADPPYDLFNIDEIILLSQFAKKGTTLVLSHPKTQENVNIPGFDFVKSRVYAAANISIYKKI